MKIEYVGLWQKVEQFQIDSPAASLPYSRRLARENRWTPEFAGRVIEEYKRFAFAPASVVGGDKSAEREKGPREPFETLHNAL